MNRVRPALVAVLLALTAVAGVAQETAPPQSGGVAARAGRGAGRNEISLEIGVLTGGFSYARRMRATPLSVGAGVWGAWEPPNTFDRNVWEPLGVVVFGRYRPTSWFHTDVGATVGRYVWADDCSDCSGTFVGVRSVALAGYRFVFFGPEIAFGRVSDDQHGSDVGVIWGAQLRFLVEW